MQKVPSVPVASVIKSCVQANLHQAVTVPESFAGAGLMEIDFTLVASSVVANSSPWPQEVLNKGGLGQQTLLTSQITLKNGDDRVSVRVQWDSGSESSFFPPSTAALCNPSKENLLQVRNT